MILTLLVAIACVNAALLLPLLLPAKQEHEFAPRQVELGESPSPTLE